MAPGTGELYPPWKGMQYMHNMIDRRANLDISDRDRYAAIQWTSHRIYLRSINKRIDSTIFAQTSRFASTSSIDHASVHTTQHTLSRYGISERFFEY
jgi:hypothetical protein